MVGQKIASKGGTSAGGNDAVGEMDWAWIQRKQPLSGVDTIHSPPNSSRSCPKNRLKQAVVERLGTPHYFVSTKNVDFVESVVIAVADNPHKYINLIGPRVSRIVNP
ncbi:hypothetical protein [Stieleria sp. JC731]|uniref:hypothetical protein n=1 Tax=Stieleria sp. JC731 TaxID=2894195 RepID=UPI001E31845E|nr:hypothetical protein [Stieleria sp. JC731]